MRAGVVAGMLAAALSSFGALPARAGDGSGAVTAWVEVLATGDRDRIAATLAPEFQILRSDGRGYAKADYLAGGLPKLGGAPKIEGLVETRAGDLLVVRYALSLAGTIDGQSLEGLSPRLTVFRRQGDAWLVVAHANFAKLAK